MYFDIIAAKLLGYVDDVFVVGQIYSLSAQPDLTHQAAGCRCTEFIKGLEYVITEKRQNGASRRDLFIGSSAQR